MNTWLVFGFDTFSNERYVIFPQHEFDKEATAREMVRSTLLEIERDQPKEDTGDPDEDGSIQDYVILVHPDGVEEVFDTNHLKDFGGDK